MAKLPTHVVSRECIDALFVRLGIWEMIKDGSLTTEPIEKTLAISTGYPNATSQIIKHRTLNGNHLATTHRVIDNDDEQVYHWDAKDIVIDGIRMVRP